MVYGDWSIASTASKVAVVIPDGSSTQVSMASS